MCISISNPPLSNTNMLLNERSGMFPQTLENTPSFVGLFRFDTQALLCECVYLLKLVTITFIPSPTITNVQQPGGGFLRPYTLCCMHGLWKGITRIHNICC